MSITITLPDEVQARLQLAAQAQHRSLEEVALDVLINAAGPEPAAPTPEEVVARIRETPRNPESVREATGSLATALASSPRVSDFDLEVWERQWAAAESQIRAATRANDIAEGRA